MGQQLGAFPSSWAPLGPPGPEGGLRMPALAPPQPPGPGMWGPQPPRPAWDWHGYSGAPPHPYAASVVWPPPSSPSYARYGEAAAPVDGRGPRTRPRASVAPPSDDDSEGESEPPTPEPEEGYTYSRKRNRTTKGAAPEVKLVVVHSKHTTFVRKAKVAYNCRRCGQLRRGHVCPAKPTNPKPPPQ